MAVRLNSADPHSPLVSSYERLLRIWETHCGCDAGWVGEYEGRPAVLLTDCQTHDMFWNDYEFTIIAEDAELRHRLQTFDFWVRDWNSLVWRNRLFGDVAEFAFPAAAPFNGVGRLSMRGLYLPVRHRRWWDDIMLWIRRQRRNARRPAPQETVE